MFPQQGEPRFVMVELDILPRLVVVAAIAFFAQTPFVFVVLAVASEARCRRVAELGLLTVARLA